jgi:hypothetical protein
MRHLNRDSVGGAMLLVAGFLLLGERLFPNLVALVPLLIGLALLAVFLVTRSPNALVNGSVIAGIGVGVLVVKGGNPDIGATGFIVSLAGGFYLAWILGLIFDVPSVRWWPVVPGSILLALGAIVYTAHAGQSLVAFAVDWWPALLVIMGAYLLLHGRLRARPAEEEETSAVPVAGARAASAPRGGETQPVGTGASAGQPAEAVAQGGARTPAPPPNAAPGPPYVAAGGSPLRPGRSIRDAGAGGQLGGDRPGSNGGW